MTEQGLTDQAVFETAVEKALRRMSETDAKGEEYMAQFKEMLRSIVRGVVQIHMARGVAPEVATHLATRTVLQMAGIEGNVSQVSPRLMQFPAHQKEWVKGHIRQFIEEIRKEGIA